MSERETKTAEVSPDDALIHHLKHEHNGICRISLCSELSMIGQYSDGVPLLGAEDWDALIDRLIDAGKIFAEKTIVRVNRNLLPVVVEPEKPKRKKKRSGKKVDSRQGSLF